MAALSDAVPPEVWRQIVERARDDALAGDPRARDWLAGYLLRNAPQLLELAAAEHAGESTEAEIDRAARRLKRSNLLNELLEG